MERGPRGLCNACARPWAQGLMTLEKISRRHFYFFTHFSFYFFKNHFYIDVGPVEIQADGIGKPSRVIGILWHRTATQSTLRGEF